MLSRFVILFTLISASSAFADESYVRCLAGDGNAEISLCNSNGSSSRSGKLNFTAYDKNGRVTNSGWCIGIGIAILGCDDMCNESVSSKAVYCTASWD